DTVHDHRVRRDAERGRKALVALRRRDSALRADVLLREAVQLEHRHAGLEALADERERLGDERAGASHPLDLGLRLADDHDATSRSRAASSAWPISANTSGIVRSACTFTSLPVAR